MAEQIHAKSGRRVLRLRIPQLVVMTLVCMASMPSAWAQSKSTLDEELNRLIGNPPEQKQHITPQDIPSAMRSVSDKLIDGELEAVSAEQVRILQAIDELIRQQPREQTQQQASTGGESGMTQQQAPPGEEGQQTGGTNNGPAEESLAGSGSGTTSTTVSRDRKSLTTSVWGHLPDRVREQLQRSYREQYLPEYEQQIEDYYRRLAERASQRTDKSRRLPRSMSNP